MTTSSHNSSLKKRKYTTPKGHVVHLTRAQKAYADNKLADPDKTLVQAAHEAYPAASPQTLRQVVNQNEKNKAIAIYTNDQVNKAKTTVVEIMSDETNKADVRLKAADSILDREVGKPTVKVQTQNTNLNLNIEASQELADSFAVFLEQQTRA